MLVTIVGFDNLLASQSFLRTEVDELQFDSSVLPTMLVVHKISSCLAMSYLASLDVPFACMPLVMRGVVHWVLVGLTHVWVYEWYLGCFCRLAPCLCIERLTCISFHIYL